MIFEDLILQKINHVLNVCLGSFSDFPGIIERVGLGGTFEGHPVHSPCSEQGHLQLDQGAQSPVQPGLEYFQGWGISHSLGNLCQGFTTLTAKYFFLISSLNLPSLVLKPLLLVLSLQCLLKCYVGIKGGMSISLCKVWICKVCTLF